MKKIKFLIILLLVLNTAFGQDSLKVKLHPTKMYPWSVLYQIKDVKQDYINNKKLNKDSLFVYNMNHQPAGMYLLMYDMDSHNFIYFIYHKENVDLEVFPKKHNKVIIHQSKENKVFLPYATRFHKLVGKLNKIEKKLAGNTLTKADKDVFKGLKKQLNLLQIKYLKKSKGLLAHKYILNMAEYYPSISMPKKLYFKDKQAHYLNHLNFDDPDLQHSNILINKINTYVFDINPPQNPKTKHLVYLKRIETILPKIKNQTYRDNVIFSLTSSFVNIDGRVSKKLIEKYIDKMPEREKKKINLKTILNEIGVTIGEKAPDFKFQDLKEHHYTLYQLTPKKPYTLLIFWSATCPHCLRAMPKIKDMMKNRKDFNVIAIGLESEKYPWSSEHQYYPDFYHGLKLKKWENPIVKTFGIHATPTFFILNKQAEVIAKPYLVKDIKTWLQNHKK